MVTVPVYAALLALLFVALSVRTLRLRRHLRIPVGDSGNLEMLRAMRVHANFAEYVPLSLLLFYFVEVQGHPALLVHLLCLSLLSGRIAHAYGVSQSAEQYAFRVTGMALTFTSMIVAAVALLVF